MIITIEGGDQAGKKTQTALLAKTQKKKKIKTKIFSFPDYKTPIGKEVSNFLHGKRKFSPTGMRLPLEGWTNHNSLSVMEH